MDVTLLGAAANRISPDSVLLINYIRSSMITNQPSFVSTWHEEFKMVASLPISLLRGFEELFDPGLAPSRQVATPRELDLVASEAKSLFLFESP